MGYPVSAIFTFDSRQFRMSFFSEIQASMQLPMHFAMNGEQINLLNIKSNETPEAPRTTWWEAEAIVHIDDPVVSERDGELTIINGTVIIDQEHAPYLAKEGAVLARNTRFDIVEVGLPDNGYIKLAIRAVSRRTSKTGGVLGAY